MISWSIKVCIWSLKSVFFFFYLSETSDSEADGSHRGPVKSKHREEDDDDATNTEMHEAKRLKFEKEEEDDNEDGREKELDEKQSPCTSVAESSSDVLQSSSDVTAEAKDNKPDELVTEDQGTFFYSALTTSRTILIAYWHTHKEILLLTSCMDRVSEYQISFNCSIWTLPIH